MTPEHKTALLVIDVQQGLFERANPIYKSQELLDNINALAARARQAGAPVIYIQHSNDNFLKMGTPNWALHPQIRPAAGEPLVHKLQGDAFEKTELGELLAERQVRRLVITGMVTHGCVKATCLGALKRGYQAVLVADAHSNFHKKAAALIQEWNQKLAEAGAELQTTAEVAF